MLQEADISFGKTHNLISLLELLLPLDSSWEMMRVYLEPLTVYAVLYRYPGESADKETAREAVKCCGVVRSRAREVLALV